MASRRTLFKRVALASVALGAALFGYAVFVEPGRLVVEQTSVAVSGLAKPLRVVVLADLHVGAPHIGLAKLRTIVSRVNAEDPDLVVLLGDYVIDGVTGGTPTDIQPIAAQLGELHARHGVFAVLGNHDWWNDGERIGAALESVGITVLEDRSVRVEVDGQSLALAGVSDLMTRPADLNKALTGVDDDEVTLVLTHNPDIFPNVPEHVELTLAGHTHGGQVHLPLVGRPIVPSVHGERYAAGLVQEDGRTLFVSTGVGTSIFPIRFRVVPRIDVLQLRPG